VAHVGFHVEELRHGLQREGEIAQHTGQIIVLPGRGIALNHPFCDILQGIESLGVHHRQQGTMGGAGFVADVDGRIGIVVIVLVDDALHVGDFAEHTWQYAVVGRAGVGNLGG